MVESNEGVVTSIEEDSQIDGGYWVNIELISGENLKLLYTIESEGRRPKEGYRVEVEYGSNRIIKITSPDHDIKPEPIPEEGYANVANWPETCVGCNQSVYDDSIISKFKRTWTDWYLKISLSIFLCGFGGAAWQSVGGRDYQTKDQISIEGPFNLCQQCSDDVKSTKRIPTLITGGLFLATLVYLYIFVASTINIAEVNSAVVTFGTTWVLGMMLMPILFTLYRSQFLLYSSPFHYYLKVRMNRRPKDEVGHKSARSIVDHSKGVPTWEPEFRNRKYAQEFAKLNPDIGTHIPEEFKADMRIGQGVGAGFWMGFQLVILMIVVMLFV